MRNFIVDDPNFSIIMPGGCNASCNFCFYKYQPATELKKIAWLERLQEVVDALPHKFQQVSVTGGEPTLDIENLLKTVAILRKRFNKVVLTTNGYGLFNLGSILNNSLVDYINISRHHHSWDGNTSIFGTKKGIKTSNEIRLFIRKAHKCGVPVTINCVATKILNISEMINWCKLVEAYAVKFREVSSHDPIYDLSVERDMAPYQPIYKEASGDI